MIKEVNKIRGDTGRERRNQREIRTYFDESKNSTSQNLWARAKPVLQEKYISLNSQIHSLRFWFSKVKKEQKIKPKSNEGRIK